MALEIISYSDFLKEIKADASGVYFFFGEEDYLKSHALRSAREAICPDPSLEFFNNVKIDCGTFDPSALANALPTLPVMADKKLIELTGINFDVMKKSDVEALISSISYASDYDFNVIILVATADGFDEGYLPKSPSAALKKMAQYAKPVRFAASTPAMLSRWVMKHFAHNGIEADPAVCAEFVEYCGRDMFVLANETDKMSWFLHSNGRQKLEKRDIAEVCIPDTGYDTFAFANAVSARKRAEALDILAEMQRRRIDPTIVLGEIVKVFGEMLNIRLLADDGLSLGDISKRLRIHEYRVKLSLSNGVSADRLRKALAMCAEADLSLKLSSQGYIALEKLICAL